MNKYKGAVPHIIAVALFLIVSYAYFYPVLEGKVLKANDSMVSRVNSKEIQDFRAKYDREPLWTNSIFSGMPAYLISTKYPGNLIKQVDLLLRSFKMPVSVLFISMAGFYILLLIFGVNPWLAMTGAIAFAFSSYFFQILAAGHNSKAIAMAYMAPMIGGVYYSYRYDAIKGALLTTLALALEIVAGHPQITYYGLMCLLIFGAVELVYSVKNKKITDFLRKTAILMVPFILSVGINFANLYTTYEYGKYSIRGKSDLTSENMNRSSGLDKDYITYWSYGIDETLNFLIPDFKGGSSKPFDKDSETVKVLRQNNAGQAVNQFTKYWGTQPGTDGPHYVGAIVMFLFVLGLIVLKGREKWWLLIATVLSILLAWGKNFMPFTNLFIDYFPGYNKFRAVTMILVIAQFCIPLLGFLALRNYYNGSLSKKEMLKGLKIATGITGGLLLLILFIPGIAGSFISPYETGADLPDWLTSALVSDRKGLLRADSIRSLIYILLASGSILGFISGKLRKEYSILIITILIMFDLWGAGKRYLDADRFERPLVIQKSFLPSAADALILDDKTYYRVLNLSVSTFNDNSPTSWFHKSIGGYHGAKLKRYQELIDSSIIHELSLFQAMADKATSIEDLMPVFNFTPVLNMLNAKYVIYNPEAPPLINPLAMGNVWFVEKSSIVGSANQELAALKTIDPLKEAVIDIKFDDQVTEDSYQLSPGDAIELVSYKPDELEYKYTAQGERLAVFSEIYYPAGWKCFIDGIESNYFRTDYVMRGMIVPAGSHQIRFAFKPSSYYVGNKVSLASSIFLILLATGYFILLFMKKPKS